jgi:hypothetical protein
MPKRSAEAYTDEKLKEPLKIGGTGNMTSLFRGFFSSCIIHSVLMTGVFAYHLSQITKEDPNSMHATVNDVREKVSEVLAARKFEEKNAREFKERTGQDLGEAIGKLNPTRRLVFEQYRDVVTQRVVERAANIDLEKIGIFKADILRKLQAGEEVPYDEFIFNVEMIEGGVDAQTIVMARRIFAEEMSVLAKEKPLKSTIEFLNRIIKFTEQYDSEAYEWTQSNVSVYLARKGKNKRGNCEARQKYRTMALLYLYPELKEKIKIQYMRSSLNAMHLRALIEVGGEMYMLEDSVQSLTNKERCGTIIYSPRLFIENYAGYNNGPIELECPEKVEVEETRPIVSIPTPPTDSVMEQPKPAQPLPPLKWAKTDVLMDYYLPPETENGNPVETENQTELLLLEDLSTEDLRKRLETDGIIYFDEDVKSPTVETIRRANTLVQTDGLLGVAYEGDISTYTPEALAEALNNNASWTEFFLPYPVLTPALKHIFQNEDKYSGEKGWLFVKVKAPLKLEEGKQTISGFSKEDLEAMNHGRKSLSIHYQKDHHVSIEELRIIGQINRPYVQIQGVCMPAIIFDRNFLHSLKPILTLTTQDYLFLAVQDPDLLQERKLQSISFVDGFTHSRNIDKGLLYHNIFSVILMIRQFEERGVNPENVRILREMIEKFKKVLPNYLEDINRAEKDSTSYAVPENLPQFIRRGCETSAPNGL